MENFTSTTTWKHLKTSPTHIRLLTRKTCVSWMKSIADRSFSLLSSGKVDASRCSYCENVSCSCRYFAAFCFAVFLFILKEIMCSCFMEKLSSMSETTTLSFIFRNVWSSHRARGALPDKKSSFLLSSSCNILAQAVAYQTSCTFYGWGNNSCAQKFPTPSPNPLKR